MNLIRGSIAAAIASLLAGAMPLTLSAQSTAAAKAIVGAWTLNKDLSDTATAPGGGGGERGRGGRGSGGQGGGGGGRGGYGGGFGGGGMRGGGGGRGGNPEDMQRRMNAMRAINQAPDRLTIVQTESMVIITAGDGTTTRLATDNHKIKDESTGIERKTHWDGGKLISEITGSGPNKITQTYEVDPDTHRLTVTMAIDSKDNSRPPVHHVYDAETADR